jgi:HEAT repeat protein/type 1 glutamine amidotransferase
MRRQIQAAFLCCLTLSVGLSLAAPLPDDIRAAVKQVRLSDGVQPRQPFYLLEQAVPRVAGDAEQRRELAGLLAEAVCAADTTPAVRTVLCQHLAQVAGDSARAVLRNLLADPATAGDARIALGDAAVAPMAAQPAAVYLTEAADPKPSTRMAGLSSLAHLYPARAVPACVVALRDADDRVGATAIRLLGRLDGTALVRELPTLDAPRQALALDALAEHRVTAVRDAAARLSGSADEAVKQAAVRALGATGDAGSVSVLAGLGATEALARLNAPGVDEAIIKGIGAGESAARVTLINAAVKRSLSGLTPVLLRATSEVDEEVRGAALKTLGRNGEVSAYPQVVALLGGVCGEEAESAVRLMGRRMADRQTRLAPLLARLAGASPPVQVAVLRTLAPLGGDDALAAVRERLDSPDAAVREAAVRALVEWPDAAAVEPLRKLADDPAASAVHRTLAGRALERLAAVWTRYAALAYLDCGAASDADGKQGVRLRVATGKPWTFTEQPEGTVAFDPGEVVVEAAGLKTGQMYQLGFSWWDYDGNGRAQSVWADGQQVIAKTGLPSWKDKQETAATLTTTLPAAAVEDGNVTIRFRREAASNAVVGEVWLSALTGQEPAMPGAATVAENLPVLPVVKANPGAQKKVLIITGLEHHNTWQQTTPLLVGAFAADARVEISVSEDPRVMTRAEVLQPYDGFVLHYNNSDKKPSPDGALATLKQAVEEGRGLVLVHFASGAFYDWDTKTVAPAFGEIAGRVWNPALRGHDPYGAFTIHIADTEHPVTKGLSDFETVDELYTCLDGTAPIRVLAAAVSKVDKKTYPLAFVLEPGKGRTFHCALGHNVQAFNGPVLELFRRGTVWSLKLEN